ncbi:Uncharacterized protein TCM_002833 isoform 1 [Theobroma cacao]|uniref:Uncharacterized protein isoform 1 n=1 Tax=Theobroma cacao TaxID=3641 RepID=A0A061DP34_THECC|nr:Uncharacterized protein TCM_002833 isoform 1 [Theobroma cacao]EOX93856.1 Uncharacterized protein TCM_002833 isoform 1 [Theobroma cacao]
MIVDVLKYYHNDLLSCLWWNELVLIPRFQAIIVIFCCYGCCLSRWWNINSFIHNEGIHSIKKFQAVALELALGIRSSKGATFSIVLCWHSCTWILCKMLILTCIWFQILCRLHGQSCDRG